MGMDYSRAKDWIVAERGFEPEHLGKCESIMCQGNGYLCLRNATDEFNPREQRDLFVAGTFTSSTTTRSPSCQTRPTSPGWR